MGRRIQKELGRNWGGSLSQSCALFLGHVNPSPRRGEGQVPWELHPSRSWRPVLEGALQARSEWSFCCSAWAMPEGKGGSREEPCSPPLPTRLLCAPQAGLCLQKGMGGGTLTLSWARAASALHGGPQPCCGEPAAHGNGGGLGVGHAPRLPCWLAASPKGVPVVPLPPPPLLLVGPTRKRPLPTTAPGLNQRPGRHFLLAEGGVHFSGGGERSRAAGRGHGLCFISLLKAPIPGRHSWLQGGGELWGGCSPAPLLSSQ